MWEIPWVGFFLLLFLILLYTIPYFKPSGLPWYFVPVAFILKVIAGYLVFWVYTFHYPDRLTADIFKYFDDSKILYDTLYTNPLDYFKMLFGMGNDNAHFNVYYQKMNNWCGIFPSNLYGDGHIMIRLNALLRIVSFGSYHVHSIILNFMSLIGLIGIFRFFEDELFAYRKTFFILLIIFPSVLFWGSGLLKEGLVLFAIGYYLFLLRRKLLPSFNWIAFIQMLLMLLILRYTKFNLFVFLLPLSIAYYWTATSNARITLRRYLIVIVGMLTLAMLLPVLSPLYNLPELIARKQQDFLQLARYMNAGSLIVTDPLKPEWYDQLSNSLPGLLRTLFRPYPWEVSNIMMVLPAIENLLLLGSLLTILIYPKKPQKLSILLFSVLFFLFSAAVIGLITPVTGALVRYKAPLIPFLIASLLLLLDKDALMQKISKFVKA